MRLPSFRRLLEQDYPTEFKKLITILAVSLNNGVQVLYDALNNQLTIRDNFKASVRDISLTVDSDGKPTQNSAFSLNTTDKVEGVIVFSVINQVNSNIYPVSAVQVFGAQSTNSFIIAKVTGLQPSTSYLIRVVAFQS